MISISRLTFAYCRGFDAVALAVERFFELFVVPVDAVVRLDSVLRSGTS